MLWIPVLAFGYEVNGVEFSGPPAPEPTEYGLLFQIYAWTALACFVVGGIISSILTIGGIWNSLKFNYHLYVTHGIFAFWTVDEGSKAWNQRQEIAKKLKVITEESTISDDTEITFLAWWPVLIIIVVVWFVAVIGSALWPVVLFLGLPFFLIRTIALRARKKQVFVDKLKDKETNGLV